MILERVSKVSLKKNKESSIFALSASISNRDKYCFINPTPRTLEIKVTPPPHLPFRALHLMHVMNAGIHLPPGTSSNALALNHSPLRVSLHVVAAAAQQNNQTLVGRGDCQNKHTQSQWRTHAHKNLQIWRPTVTERSNYFKWKCFRSTL